MSKKTWVEKIIDKKSKWLKATKLEKEGKLREAAKEYLEEAKKQESKNIAMAALSYLSAAKCLMKVGERERAMELFKKAGDKYREYGESIISLTPTSTAWAYNMASKCYMWAEEYGKAEELRKMAESISEKIEPKLSDEGVPLFRAFKRKKRR